MESEDEEPSPNRVDCSDIPALVLRRIYSFLSIEDLASVQFVCRSWSAVAFEVGVWKKVPLEIKSERAEEIVAKLQKLPALKVITSKSWYYGGSNEIINALTENVDDLYEMNIDFRPPLSAQLVQKLVDNFVHLECIKIDGYAFDLIEILNILTRCKNLREIKFSFANSTIPFSSRYDPFKQRLDPIDGNVCRIIGDFFPNLNVLDIRGFQIRVTDVDMIYLLYKKRNSLVKLTAVCKSNMNTDVLGMITSCLNLERLVLFVHGLPLPLNLQNLTRLRSLSLYASTTCEAWPIYSIVFPPNLEILSIHFSCPLLRKGFLRNIVYSLRRLKHLYLYGIHSVDVEGELSDTTRRLPNLQTLVLFSIPEIPTQNIEFVGRCPNLRHLAINLALLSDDAFQHIKKCPLLQKIIFWECKFNPKNLMPLISSLKYLTEFSMTGCYANTDEINAVVNECTIQGLPVRFKIHFY